MKNIWEIRGNTLIIWAREHGVLVECYSDPEALPRLDALRGSWYVDPLNGYVQMDLSVAGRKRRYYMHRVVARTPDGMLTDHKDGKRRNNRSSNLRPCNNKQNSQNSRPYGKTGVRNVAWHKQRGKYHVQLNVGGKKISGGLHSDLAKANDVAVALRRIHFPFSVV